MYLFTGLPVADGTGTDDYLVWVNDTDHVLGELTATYDCGRRRSPTRESSDGLGIARRDQPDDRRPYHATRYGLRLRAARPRLRQTGSSATRSFWTATATTRSTPARDWRAWSSSCWTATGRLLATTVTDEIRPLLLRRPGAGTYTVQVETTTLPGGAGLTNTVDPDTASPGDSQSPSRCARAAST